MRLMKCTLTLAVASMAAMLSFASAQAAPCEWTLESYPLPPSNDVKLDCTCGPPSGGMLLDLSELMDELADPDEPEPYPGTLLQTIGGVAGTWTYSMGSNICMAAQHAGLIADPDFGAEVRIAPAPGCDSYEGSTRNGINSQNSGSSARSFYFPEVSDGACPGEDGYLPERIVLGRFADTWTAAQRPRSDGTWRCSAYSRAAGSDPDERHWLHMLHDHLRYVPGTDIPDDARVTITIGDVRWPMAVRDGQAFIPTSIAIVARALATGSSLTLTVERGDDSEPESLDYPLTGLTDAYVSMAEACGFDPSALLGED